MGNYVISCCSTADLSKDHFDAIDVKYICFHFELDGKQYEDNLGVSIPFDEFYSRMANGADTKTSQVNAEEFEEYFRSFLEQGLDILHVSLSSGISGVINSANIAKETLQEVGAGMAKQMIYTARNIKADEAYRIGLVNAVYPLEELLPAAKKMAAGIAANAPIAVRNCKKAINDGLQVDMDTAIVIEEKLFGDCFETEDQKAGMGNFLEKDKEKKLKVVPFQNK